MRKLYRWCKCDVQVDVTPPHLDSFSPQLEFPNETWKSRIPGRATLDDSHRPSCPVDKILLDTFSPHVIHAHEYRLCWQPRDCCMLPGSIMALPYNPILVGLRLIKLFLHPQFLPLEPQSAFMASVLKTSLNFQVLAVCSKIKPNQLQYPCCSI